MPNLINQVLLNQYRVDAFIASGGTGAVYRVWDLERNVPLAMKVLHSDLAEDPHMFRRFQREANALKKLSHPNIVPFYGLFQTSGFVFLLERYIDGPSLRDVLRDQGGKPLPIPETLTYFKALSSALGYAHSKGVVHCDVKPGNILMDRGGNIYLADFGIARHADSTTTTMAGAGTAAYMAPEQIMEQPLTPATDVYSLGVMLFEMVTGQRPFRGNEVGTERSGQAANERIRAAHLRVSPPDPRSIISSIPAALANVILQSLDKRPEYRYRTAAEFFSAICAALGIAPDSIGDRTTQGLGSDVGAGSPAEGPRPDGSGTRKSPGFLLPLIAGIGIVGFLAVCGAAVMIILNRPTLTLTPRLTSTFTETPLIAPLTDTPGTPITAGPNATENPTAIPAIKIVRGAEMVLIPAGEFTMGDTLDQALAECRNLFPTASAENCKEEYFTDETPPHQVSLDAYYIDKYEVTNALYKACADDGVCRKPANTNSETHPSYYSAAEYNNYPVIWVDRNMAQTYCQWRDARLPTEAEWEKAARGVSSLFYPWGNSFDGARANSCDANCPRQDYANANFNDGYSEIAPVDAFADGISMYNVYNLSGNVSEWVSDWYSLNTYSLANGLVSNPTGPQNGGEYVIRGGSWLRFPINLRLVTRSSNRPTYSANDLGFRCASSIP